MRLAFLVVMLLSFSVQAETLKVAVSANFKPVLEPLARKFEQSSCASKSGKKCRVLVSTGSTGTLYNQIVNGAPYDLFFSADSARPAKLEQKQKIVSGSRKPYAYGRLVLWDRRASDTDEPISLSQLSGWQQRIAIANPGTAPYGLAAKQVLEHLELWSSLRKQLVMGNSVQQAWQFVASGNVSVGMVALSQLPENKRHQAVLIPDNLYKPIRQEMVVLKGSQLSGQFADFILSEASQRFIAEHGYYSVSNQSAADKEQ